MVVGYMLGKFFHEVQEIKKHKSLIVGVGLGGQVAHFAAEHLRRDNSEHEISEIIGLDPIAHHFQGYDRQYINGNYTVRPYRSAKDAKKITIIHTSAISRAKTSEIDIRLARMGHLIIRVV